MLADITRKLDTQFIGQGCGIFGTGLLVDNAGDDYCWLYQYGQGYGYTMGCGMLVDGSGNEQVLVHDNNLRDGTTAIVPGLVRD